MSLRKSLVAAVLVLAAAAACGKTACPTDADAVVLNAWEQYREGDIESARSQFRRIVARCPDHIGARVGLGYAEIRSQNLKDARELFEEVISVDSSVVDALVGLGMVAWREGDTGLVQTAFRRALSIEPDNEVAQQYLNRLGPSLGARPERPPIVLPDSVGYSSRVEGDYFETRTEAGWELFYVKGVNLGTALPGKHASEFPDSATYSRWISAIGYLGANAIRVYTIHPPMFYQALLDYNTRHAAEPLWLIHGVWAELPPDHLYDAQLWESEFFREMHAVVDLLHGRADIEPRQGHAWGFYTADVSNWVLGYIIGREWEPFSVVEFNKARSDLVQWSGNYISVNDGWPMEVWLGKACDEITTYEMRKYRTQRPVAYTNWPTLDPMSHPTETSVTQEVAHRESIGEDVKRIPKEYDNDAVGLDATRMVAHADFPAGVFSAFHAYPYYPDFMILDPVYSRARSTIGESNYFGYLRHLKRHHPDMPVLIAEYGVPASLGIAHLQPQGWHHGGHSESSMAEIDEILTLEIFEAGMAGGAIFAWIDEWFKKNWIVIEYELPPDRNRLWLNRLDAEQHYGLLAMEPGATLTGTTLRDRKIEWQDIRPLYEDDTAVLRASVDEAYLWLLFEPRGPTPAELLIGFDIVDPDAGDFRWPERIGTTLPVGIEFVLRVTENEARLLADGFSNPVFLDAVRSGLPDQGVQEKSIDRMRPAGYFSGRVEQWFLDEYVTRENSDGLYDSLRVVTNRPRFTPNGTEYLGLGYDRGVLPSGPQPDGLWERDPAGVVEARIPWMLLNFTDPSQRRVLQDAPNAERFGGNLGTVTVETIGIVAAFRSSAGSFHEIPPAGKPVARFTWPTWEQPTWRERKRPAYDALRRVYRTLTPPVSPDGRP